MGETKQRSTSRKGSSTTLRPLMDIVRRLNSETDTRKLIDLVLAELIRGCNGRRGNLIIYKGSKAREKSALNLTGQDLRTEDRRIMVKAIRSVRESGRRIVRTDVSKSGKRKLSGPLSVLCVPLLVKEQSIGCIYLDHPGVAGAFGERQVEVAEFLANHAAVAIENAQLHRERVRDKLTKVYNHDHFEQKLVSEIDQARKHGYPCGVLMIDVDNFKSINDTHGHEAGNIILRHVAKTLKETVRTADLVGRVSTEGTDRGPEGGDALVARFGGDEFEVILPATGREGVKRTAERLVAALGGKKLQVGEGKLVLSISVGGAVFPEDADDATSLKARADEALYVSKRGGKNRAAMFIREPGRSTPG